MTALDSTSLDQLIQRWDRQQELYVPYREDRFEVMATAIRVDQHLSSSPRVLDLACGPAAFSSRLFRHIPSAQYVGVDVDPVLLHLARHVGNGFDGRVEIHHLDLVDDAWSTGFDRHSFDAVVSSTALHWLNPNELETVFHQVHILLRPGGMLLNADNLAYESTRWQYIAHTVDDKHVSAPAPEQDNWASWWSTARQELPDLCAQRDLRFPPSEASDSPPPRWSVYRSALERSGFEHIDTLWQRFDDRVIAAITPLQNAS
jgi:SAM-dependent methyltransferase